MGTGSINPYSYQREAVDATFDFLRNRGGNPLIGLPTGTGKSVVLGGTIWRAFQNSPHRRVIMLTHVKELIEQNLEKLLMIWPNAPVGVYCDGLKRYETVDPIIFASVQSVHALLKRKDNPFGFRDLALIDEAHLVSPNKATRYFDVVQTLFASNPALRVIGYTATAFRQKQGLLTDNGLFTDFAFNRCERDDFNRFIKEGYLSPLFPKDTSTSIDISNVSISSTGDYNEAELQTACNVDAITQGAVREMLEYGANRKKWLVFAAGIEHAEAVSDCLTAYGIESKAVHSKRSKGENTAALNEFKHGDLRALVNANKLTTGFDCPQIDLIGMLRPTFSPVLHVQMLGRGTRRHPEKANCLVLDFAKNVTRLGPINDPVKPRKPGDKAPGAAPVRPCAVCGILNHAASRECMACGYGFPIHERKHLTTEAGTSVVVAGLEAPKEITLRVRETFCSLVKSKSGKAMLRVSYLCAGSRTVSELVMLEHAGIPRIQAVQWWQRRNGGMVPNTVGEAIAHFRELNSPQFVTVRDDGSKYPEVIGVQF